MYNEKALREAYAKGGSSAMYQDFMSTNKNAKRSSNGRGWQSVQKGTSPNNINEYKALQATLDNERRSRAAQKAEPKPVQRPEPRREAPAAEKPRLRLAGSDNFNKELAASKKDARAERVSAAEAKKSARAERVSAVEAQRNDRANRVSAAGAQKNARAERVNAAEAQRNNRAAQVAKVKASQSSQGASIAPSKGGINYEKAPEYNPNVEYEKAPEYTPTKITQETREELDTRTNNDYNRQVDRNKAQSLNDASSARDWTQEFTNRHINNNRAIVQSRGDDQFNTAGKYINRMENSGGINLEALDKKTNMAPLYDKAQSELSNLNIFGDRYKASRENPAKWSAPGAYEGPKSPDLSGIGNTWYDRISDIGL